MFIVGPVLHGIIALCDFVLVVFFWMIFFRILVSWVNPDPYNPIVRFLSDMVDPLLNRTRQLMPFMRIGMFDLSPIVLLFGIEVLRQILRQMSMMVS